MVKNLVLIDKKREKSAIISIKNLFFIKKNLMVQIDIFLSNFSQVIPSKVKNRKEIKAFLGILTIFSLDSNKPYEDYKKYKN
jgi:hypothetical protein